jgi:hypothetical protein
LVRVIVTGSRLALALRLSQMANPAAPPFNERFINKVNRWHKYNYPDALDLTEDDVRSLYRTGDYITFNDLGPNPPPIVRGAPGPIVIPFQQPLSPNEQRFWTNKFLAWGLRRLSGKASSSLDEEDSLGLGCGNTMGLRTRLLGSLLLL